MQKHTKCVFLFDVLSPELFVVLIFHIFYALFVLLRTQTKICINWKFDLLTPARNPSVQWYLPPAIKRVIERYIDNPITDTLNKANKPPSHISVGKNPRVRQYGAQTSADYSVKNVSSSGQNYYLYEEGPGCHWAVQPSCSGQY
jgi:hypothetical protein